MTTFDKQTLDGMVRDACELAKAEREARYGTVGILAPDVACHVKALAAFAEEAFAEIERLQSDAEEATAEMKERVGHWRIKAKCYGDIVHGCSPALEAAGFPVDTTNNDGAVGGIRRAVEAMAAEIERVRSQLPPTMPDCTIRFLECSKGHGRITADNWVDRGCLSCEVERLRGMIDQSADGVLLPDCEELFCPHGHKVREVCGTAYCDDCEKDEHGNWPVPYFLTACYSTREAAKGVQAS